MTGEPVPLPAIEMPVVVGAPYTWTYGSASSGYKPSIEYWKTNNSTKTWIEIIKDRNSIIPIDALKNKAISIIRNYFDPDNFTLGQVLNIGELYNRLVLEDGIDDVRTVLNTTERGLETFSGLSFITWPNTPIFADFKNNGDTVPPEPEQFTNIYSYMPFQYPKFIDQLNNQVKVLYSISNQIDVEY
jgi:hypothetical protein